MTQLETDIRQHRTMLLERCDWTQGKDAADICDQEAWAKYRQDLRDITRQAGWPTDIQWPIEP